MTPEEFDVARQQVIESARRVVAEHGWQLLYVFPTETAPGPAFHYTAGLTQFRVHPELITFSMPQAVGGIILNMIGEKVRDGLNLVGGVELTDIASVPLRLVEVDDTTVHFGMARSLFPAVRALQVVWPDPFGRWPWAAGFEAKAPQPLLGRWPA